MSSLAHTSNRFRHRSPSSQRFGGGDAWCRWASNRGAVGTVLQGPCGWPGLGGETKTWGLWDGASPVLRLRFAGLASGWCKIGKQRASWVTARIEGCDDRVSGKNTSVSGAILSISSLLHTSTTHFMACLFLSEFCINSYGKMTKKWATLLGIVLS